MTKAEDFITTHTRNDINTELGWMDNGESTLLVYPWLTPSQARITVKIEGEERIEKVYAAFCKTCKFNCNCNQESIIISIKQ